MTIKYTVVKFMIIVLSSAHITNSCSNINYSCACLYCIYYLKIASLFELKVFPLWNTWNTGDKLERKIIGDTSALCHTKRTKMNMLFILTNKYIYLFSIITFTPPPALRITSARIATELKSLDWIRILDLMETVYLSERNLYRLSNQLITIFNWFIANRWPTPEKRHSI